MLANDLEPNEMKKILPELINDPYIDEIEFYEEEVCPKFYEYFLQAAQDARRPLESLKK